MKTDICGKSRAASAWCLAGVLILTSSVSAFGAAPQAPIIDWAEPLSVYPDSGANIEVDLGWSRVDMDDVSSVQYRANGTPIATRAVSAEVYSGQMILEVPPQAKLDLTVALCNVDGCSESDPVSVSIDGIIDDSVSVFERSYDPDSSDIPMSLALATETQSFCTAGSQANMQVANTAVSSSLATAIGKIALKGLVRAGVNFGFNEIMEELGLGEKDITEQIADLQSSTQVLNNNVQQLSCDIEKLNDTVNWGGFIIQHTLASNAVTTIYNKLEVVSGYIDNGITPDYNAWSSLRSAISDAVGDLAGSKTTNGSGMVDRPDGAIYQLMGAVPQRVASVDSYWPEIEQYRDYYRTAIAMGYLALDLIENEFDGSGTTGVEANVALEAGQLAVRNMYAYGIPPERPVSGEDILDFVQVRGSTKGYATAEFAELDSNATREMAGLELKGDFATMALEYRPEHHGGLTLQEFLTEANVPTVYFLDNPGGWKSTGWEVTKKDLGMPHLGRPPGYEVKPKVGRVVDNAWIVSFEAIKGQGLVYAFNDSQIAEAINDFKSQLRAQGGFKPVGMPYAQGYFAAVDLSDRLNIAGRAAEFDEDDVRTAAFGDDGNARLKNGSLPGADNGGECLDIPAITTELMAVDNYSLRWKTNGNLLVRADDGSVLWKTATADVADQLCWQSDGDLALYSGSDIVWQSDTSDDMNDGLGGRKLILQQDGALKIIDATAEVMWEVGPFE